LSERNSHCTALLSQSLYGVPPALNRSAECVIHALVVGRAAELLVDRVQNGIVFRRAGALRELFEFARAVLVESECHCHTGMVSL